ncbi:MAG: cysteine--tRNA ligase [Tissierellia bacterium]|nr:cysteine--tRNA ligase [Tissierellia bacterium]
MKLYNTLSKTKEEFVPLKEGEVNMYVCGPTVYNYIHVGNARPLVVFDTLRRYLEYRGFKVNFALNFTDIEDKIIQKANEEGVSIDVIVERYIKAFKEDATDLNFYEREVINPRATEYIDDMIEFISGLIEMGAAYPVDGDVYFDISKAKDYGKLSGKNIDDLMAGARVDVNDKKRSPLDFALWKEKKEGEPYWESPWGQGRPGWHIECSVMNRAIFGDTIDIHAGGIDLEFPHHENEIAQTETLTGKPFARYWLHNEMMNIDGVKMSKSLNNFMLVKGVREYYDLEVLRFFLVSAHYRSPINYSKEAMDAAEAGLERIYNAKKQLEYLLTVAKSEESPKDEDILKELETFKAAFIESMDDDLNTAEGVSHVFDLVRFVNTNLDESSSKKSVRMSLDLLMELSGVLGILTRTEELPDEEINALIEERVQARKNKDFARADEIRDQLKEMGIVIEDTREGMKWKRI